MAGVRASGPHSIQQYPYPGALPAIGDVVVVVVAVVAVDVFVVDDVVVSGACLLAQVIVIILNNKYRADRLLVNLWQPFRWMNKARGGRTHGRRLRCDVCAWTHTHASHRWILANVIDDNPM